MAPGVLHRVINGTHNPSESQVSRLTVRPALLNSYTRHRVRNADYPAILPSPGDSASTTAACVRGSLVTGLTSADLYRLDIFEGDQYVRRKVRVHVLKDVGLDEMAPTDSAAHLLEKDVEAETYVWDEGEDTLEPKEWDFEEFKRDKMKAWMGVVQGEGVDVDEGFADVDRAVAEQEKARQGQGQNHDPMGGRGANGHITRQLKEAAV